ncbi:AarF/UbiB family protein [Geomonas sp. RF6]|uniref:ABC1 kinase family protein n=1 Tax=Geomonas sp. RF6 TaxID=2897342 RepID=UPI001E2A4008|nr:AarF/UbiB family protein [Geomonas sp. RF6]UFS72508.1 AarF/UbiB family protein [Geomonas sp. RF6]
MSSIRLLVRLYHPLRIYTVFRVLLTVFLLIRRRPSWLGMYPLAPAPLVSAIEELGPSFIKLAQVLATRADFFDTTYLEALRQLHDQLPPMSTADFRAVFGRAFRGAECFATFEERPIACASIGQVHRAILLTGEQVAVKLRRNRVERVVREDIRLLGWFLAILHPLFAEYTRNSIEAVLSAFSRTIVQEVDMQVEVANLERFRQTYPNSGVRFPVPYRAYSSPDALVMSYEEGIRFDDREELARLQVPFDTLMEKLVLFYTEQMLVKGFFHADPHPGNLLVTLDGDLVLLDFGMVSRIPQGTRLAMINTVKAAYERDFDLLVQATRKLGIITDTVPQDQLAGLAEDIFHIFDNEHLSATSMQELAFGVMDTMKDYPFKLPQEIIYVMRASSIIEGLGTSYIENFNGIKDILPILKANLGRALGEGNDLWGMVGHEIRQLPLTLVKARHLVDTMHQGELFIRVAEEDRRELLRPLHRWVLHLSWTALLVALAFYLQRMESTPAQWLSVGCLVAAALRLVWWRRTL